MEEWEYKIIDTGADTIGYFERLGSLVNELGKAGWELVCTFGDANYLIFKRRKR